MNLILSLIPYAVREGTTILLGSTGEIITQKSGNMNLGTPGIMCMGGIGSVAGAFFYENAVGAAFNPFFGILIPVLCGLLSAGLTSLLYCFLVVTLRANQNVTGLAITTFGLGFSSYFGTVMSRMANNGMSGVSYPQTAKLFKATLPFAEDLGAIGKAFFSYSFLVYVAVVIAVVASIVISKTRVGLHLRAVGENPATADAAGINVTAYKYGATCIGGMIAGLGGIYYSMAKSGGWEGGSFLSERGWLAIALVIFALWRPWLTILGSYLFGALYSLRTLITDVSLSMSFVFDMMPYLVTVLVLILISVRRKRENQPPESLGLPYFREER